MIRSPLVLGAAVAAITFTESARADDDKGEGRHRFGMRGLIVSVDRLLPLISYQSVTLTDPAGNESSQSRTSVALANTGPFSVFQSFYNLPRISFDWVVVRNLTIGSSTWIYADLQASSSITPNNKPTTSSDSPKITYWGVAPRVGYIIPLGDKIYLWPRAGVEYHHVSQSDVGQGSGLITQFAFEAEAMVVISPWDNFGFTVGPTFDAPITGEQTVTSTPNAAGVTTSMRDDSAMWQVGVSAGVLGHF
jgi:hypothetical protein